MKGLSVRRRFILKYWRGYLVALIFAVFSWALSQFAAAHGELLDMTYPYMTRVLQSGLADWSGGMEFCVWQVLFLFGILALLAGIVLMVALRWNPVQMFGWVLAVVAIVNFLSNGLYGMNQYNSSIAEDMRITSYDSSLTSLENATTYYLEQATALAGKVERTGMGTVKSVKFATQAKQAANGFQNLVKRDHYPVFAGSTAPVKELGWAEYYTEQGITGKTVGLTGEAAVNPNVPAVAMPYAMCKEMAKRMSITRESDANFAAYMACTANEDVNFQYSGALLAFRSCYNALVADSSSEGRAAYKRVRSAITAQVKYDMEIYNDFLGENSKVVENDTVTLLVNWHIQSVILPKQQEEQAEDKILLFDPLDESDPRLEQIVNPTDKIGIVAKEEAAKKEAAANPTTPTTPAG